MADPPSFKTRQSKMEKINGSLLFWLNADSSSLAKLQISPLYIEKKPLVSGNKLKLIRQNSSEVCNQLARSGGGLEPSQAVSPGPRNLSILLILTLVSGDAGLVTNHN